MRTHKIAAIPADGIGPEVIRAGCQVLDVLAQRAGDIAFDITTFDDLNVLMSVRRKELKLSM